MNIYSFLDEESKNTFEKIASALKSAKLYFAGGCVRDALLGLPSKDFDIEVYDIDKEAFEKAMDSIGAVGVGKSFFVYRIKNFDVSLPRQERKVGHGHTGFEAVVIQDKKLACARRDFTVNAMLLDAKNFELLDFFGGKNDLRSKTLRVVNGESFAEDSLRVLRAMQFAARFGFRIEPKSVDICRKIPLDDISASRIFAEFEKLFCAKYQIFGAYYLFKLRIAEKLFGINMEFGSFLRFAKNIARSRRFFKRNMPGAFLYGLFLTFRPNKNSFLDKIGAPNSYKKMFAVQKLPPKKVSERFLAGLSMKVPISEWLGAYRADVKEMAQRIGVWDEGYKPQITHQKVISMGFKNAEISKNYSLLLAKEIREKFRG